MQFDRWRLWRNEHEDLGLGVAAANAGQIMGRISSKRKWIVLPVARPSQVLSVVNSLALATETLTTTEPSTDLL